MRALMISALFLVATESFAADDLDCRGAQAVVNVNEQTDREGLLTVFHLISQANATSVIFEYDRLNPTDETARQVRFYFRDVFPNATPEYREIYRESMNELAMKLAGIPGVIVHCSEKPADSSSPRISGGFGQ